MVAYSIQHVVGILKCFKEITYFGTSWGAYRHKIIWVFGIQRTAYTCTVTWIVMSITILRIDQIKAQFLVRKVIGCTSDVILVDITVNYISIAFKWSNKSVTLLCRYHCCPVSMYGENMGRHCNSNMATTAAMMDHYHWPWHYMFDIWRKLQ